MPTYEYTCKKCHENIEVFQPFSAKPLKKHQECGGELQKVFHARGVLFKGSGFYATDSRKADKDSSGKELDTKESKNKEAASKSNGAKQKPAAKKEAEASKPATD